MIYEFGAVINSEINTVFERYSFMFAESVDKNTLEPTILAFREVSMTFSGGIGSVGSIKGSAAIIVPDGMGRILASNVLGIPEDDPDISVRADGALSEALNVICGHVLTTTMGKDPIFDLVPPVVVAADRDRWESYRSDKNSLGFIVDDFPVLFIFKIEE